MSSKQRPRPLQSKPHSARKGSKVALPIKEQKTDTANVGNRKGSKTIGSIKEKRADSRNVVDSFPDELLITLFAYLDAGDLLVASRVCHRWLQVSNDNTLWRKVAERYLPRGVRKKIGEPLEAPTQYWKKECIKGSVTLRNQRAYNKLDTPDPFTFLPDRVKPNLEKLGVIYTLAFFDRSGSHHYIRADDIFYHRMSVTARWYNFGELPTPARLQSLKLLALNPVFYDHKGVACRNSPCQRSLLCQMDFDWSELTKQTPLGSDSAVDLFRLANGLVVAAWKDGGGLAFVAGNLPYHNLIDRCLKGSFKATHTCQPGALVSDPAYRRFGLNDYSATFELRTQRQSIWSEQFRTLNKDPSGNTLIAIRSDRVHQHSPLERDIELPWKTDLFKNKTRNVCIMDAMVRDTNGRVVLAVSEFVHSSADEKAKVTYDYEGQGRSISLTKGLASILLLIDKDSLNKQVISSLTISL
ncbi:F-box only protein 15-like [Watersipora subatra]|uniref:F-box only protein 15-like n=1 Tax=Watersipora subatra TaxID=2589382 RepID=UPI00355B02BE